MALLWILMTLTISYGASASKISRIVGGNPTTIEKYPSLVQVEFQGLWSGVWAQRCAANILTTRFLLSVAHCFTGALYEPRFVRVRAGTTHRSSGGIIRYLEREFNHPYFGRIGFDSDITVLRLISPLVYSPVVQQGTIVASGTIIPDNSPVVLAGWGATSQGGTYSPILLDTTVYTVNNGICRQRYLELPNPTFDILVTSNMICAGLLDVGGRDACHGDSGAPLYFGDIIIGVVSWGHGCANASFPGVNTAVAPFTNWIISKVA